MILYHGTTPEVCDRFCKHGIDAHILHKRNIHGPQDFIAGLFVTPELDIAKRFGTRVIAIEVELIDLACPPILHQYGVSLEESLQNPLESQAVLKVYVPPERVRLVYSTQE